MAMSLTSWATGSSIGPDSEVGGCRSASRTSRKGERSGGGGIVEAPDFLSAITKSHVRGCNPCGGVAVLELPAEADEKIRAEMARGVALNTLVTREQVGRGV